jgi:hypothetical protein
MPTLDNHFNKRELVQTFGTVAHNHKRQIFPAKRSVMREHFINNYNKSIITAEMCLCMVLGVVDLETKPV